MRTALPTKAPATRSRPRAVTVFAAAFVAGAAAAVGVNRALDVKLAQAKPRVESEAIFVALHSLPQGAPVTVWDVALRDWPKAMMPATALRASDSFSGKILRHPLREGQPLLSIQLATEAQESRPAAAPPAYPPPAAYTSVGRPAAAPAEGDLWAPAEPVKAAPPAPPAVSATTTPTPPAEVSAPVASPVRDALAESAAIAATGDLTIVASQPHAEETASVAVPSMPSGHETVPGPATTPSTVPDAATSPNSVFGPADGPAAVGAQSAVPTPGPEHVVQEATSPETTDQAATAPESAEHSVQIATLPVATPEAEALAGDMPENAAVEPGTPPDIVSAAETPGLGGEPAPPATAATTPSSETPTLAELAAPAGDLQAAAAAGEPTITSVLTETPVQAEPRTTTQAPPTPSRARPAHARYLVVPESIAQRADASFADRAGQPAVVGQTATAAIPQAAATVGAATAGAAAVRPLPATTGATTAGANRGGSRSPKQQARGQQATPPQRQGRQQPPATTSGNQATPQPRLGATWFPNLSAGIDAVEGWTRREPPAQPQPSAGSMNRPIAPR